MTFSMWQKRVLKRRFGCWQQNVVHLIQKTCLINLEEFDFHHFNVVEAISHIDKDTKSFEQLLHIVKGFHRKILAKICSIFKVYFTFRFFCSHFLEKIDKRAPFDALSYKPGACPNSAASIQIVFSTLAFATLKMSFVTLSPSSSVTANPFVNKPAR